MANVIIVFKIMPESPDVDLSKIEHEAKALIEAAAGNVGEIKQEPVAFGLKAVIIACSRDEAKGGTDDLEAELRTIEGVASAEVQSVARPLG